MAEWGGPTNYDQFAFRGEVYAWDDAARQHQTSPEYGRRDVGTLRQRMDRIRVGGGPIDHAMEAGLLALDVTDAYRAALLARDVAAARLHRDHGWSAPALARVLYGDTHHAHRVRRSIDSIVDASAIPATWAEVAQEQADLQWAQARVQELRSLLTEARKLAAAHIHGRRNPITGRPDFGLPLDPSQRVRAIAEQTRLVDSYLVSLTAARNLAAAALVENAEWPLPEVSALARTSPAQIAAARRAVASQLVSYADPGGVVEVSDVIDALASRAQILGELQDEAIRELLAAGVGTERIAALSQLPVGHIERMRRPQIRNPRVANLAAQPRRASQRHAA